MQMVAKTQQITHDTSNHTGYILDHNFMCIFYFRIRPSARTQHPCVPAAPVPVHSPYLGDLLGRGRVRWSLDEIGSESLPVLFNAVPQIQSEACLCTDDN